MTTKLSLTARYLLTYIRFKTNNNRPFFAGNDTIAKVIGCTEASTKVIINTLIREGYIIKTIDDKSAGTYRFRAKSSNHWTGCI